MIDRGSQWTVRGAARRWVVPALTLAVVTGGLVVSGTPSAVAAGSQVGYTDLSYQGTTSTTPSAPTAKEVQSKLWFNDGVWWGLLYSTSARAFQIHRFDWPTQSWSSTGVSVDNRVTTRHDALWDGSHLYVASAGTSETKSNQDAKIRRFTYDSAAKKYAVESGYPVTLSPNGMQAVVIAKDGTGMVWATWTQQAKVWVTHTTTTDKTWVTPYVLPATNSTGLLDQDESGVISYNGKIGVLWGDQNTSAWGYYFAFHKDGDPDGVWQSMAAHPAADEADNHINMKSLDADPAGQIFAAVKTSLNRPNDPLYHLLVLQADNTWRTYPLARVADDWTRATVLIDKESRRIYAFGASPCCNGGAVYYKVSSLDNISFPVGQGTPLIQTSTDLNINNPTSTKQSLSSATGLLAIAGDDITHRYVHNSFGLGSGDTAPPDTTIDTHPPVTSFTSSATFGFSSSEAGSAFSCSLDGAAFSSCTSPKSYTGVPDGQHAFQVRATDFSGNADPTPAQSTWTIDTSNPTLTISPDADAEVDSATPDTNVGSSPSIVVDGSPNSEAYLRFPVTGITGTILDAKVRVFATDGTSKGPAVYGAGSTWSESGITWNSRPARTSAVLGTKAGVTSGTWVEYDVTSAVTGNGTYTFDLAPASDDGMTFSSRQSATNKPQLALIVRSDTTAPETVVDSGPSGTVGSGSAEFGFSSSEAGSTFRCSLDGAAFGGCTSPQAYPGLADGSHTFRVYASDPAGNADATPAERTWTVDTVAPAAPVILSPADGGTNSTGTVAVSGTAEPASAVAVFDGAGQKGTAAADADGSWSVTLTGVANGAHSYTAKATDPAGNTSPASATVTVTVDATAPTTSLDSGPSGTVASRSASFAFSSDKAGSTFQCSLDGAAFEACTSPQAYTGLAEGGHSFAVYAVDSLGHVDPTPATRTWTVDVTAPTVAGVRPADGATGVEAGNVSAAFSEAMDPASLSTATFTIRAEGSTSPLSVPVTYYADTDTAVLMTEQILAP
ncbi:MAG TPA: DNRLRE domain-containing protein, partial [Mycobacteriales bacterium]|nr:DNRLRE domain-containing protein [Mycobacteriales bacterium]